MIKNPSSLVGGHKPGASGVAGFIRLNKTGGNIWDLVSANENIFCMRLKRDKLTCSGNPRGHL